MTELEGFCSVQDAFLNSVVEGFKHAGVCLVLETDCEGSWARVALVGLRFGPASDLIEVEGWDVDTVTGAERVLVEMLDVFR